MLGIEKIEISGHKEDQRITNQVMELSSPKREESKPEIVVDGVPSSFIDSEDSDARPVGCLGLSLNQAVSNNISCVGRSRKYGSVYTDSVSILEEKELKDSLNADNNANAESSEVVVKHRNNLQQDSSRYIGPPQPNSDDVGSELVEQHGDLCLVEGGMVNNDDGSNCKLDGNDSWTVEQQHITQNEDSLDYTYGAVGVNFAKKNEDEILVAKSSREDNSDTMTIDVCNDDKEKEVGANDVQASVKKIKRVAQEPELQGPAKRVHCSVGNNLIVDATKPSTTERELPVYSFGAPTLVNAPVAIQPTGQGVMVPPQHEQSKKVKKPVYTLEDSFKKTTTSPRIYYLPLPAEKVAAKKRRLLKPS